MKQVRIALDTGTSAGDTEFSIYGKKDEMDMICRGSVCIVSLNDSTHEGSTPPPLEQVIEGPRPTWVTAL